LQVWASKWSDRAWLSRRARNVPDSSLFMAVLLQQALISCYSSLFCVQAAHTLPIQRDALSHRSNGSSVVRLLCLLTCHANRSGRPEQPSGNLTYTVCAGRASGVCICAAHSKPYHRGKRGGVRGAGAGFGGGPCRQSPRPRPQLQGEWQPDCRGVFSLLPLTLHIPSWGHRTPLAAEAPCACQPTLQ
jgi:hypothetical protein